MPLNFFTTYTAAQPQIEKEDPKLCCHFWIQGDIKLLKLKYAYISSFVSDLVLVMLCLRCIGGKKTAAEVIPKYKCGILENQRRPTAIITLFINDSPGLSVQYKDLFFISVSTTLLTYGKKYYL